MRKTLLCVVFLPTFCSRSADRHKFVNSLVIALLPLTRLTKNLWSFTTLDTLRSRSVGRPKFASESARGSKALGNELARFIGFTALEHHEQVIALLSLAFAAFISVGLRSTKGL